MFKSPMRGGSEAKKRPTEAELLSRPEGSTVGLNPKARPSTGILLRVNAYQLDLLRQLARQEELSMQQAVKRVLFAAVHETLYK